jgi:hypothetical protein
MADKRVHGINPWHWADRPVAKTVKNPRNDLGAGNFPKLVARLKEIATIFSNKTAPRLKADDGGVGGPVGVAGVHQLFLDEYIISSKRNVSVALHRPIERTNKQVILSDQPWENWRIWAYNSVVDNGTHILMYYYLNHCKAPCVKGVSSMSRYTCLAVSVDGGLRFTKPNLGVVSIDGSSANNCIWPPTGGGHETGNVFIDTKPGVAPAEKYKMICRWQPENGTAGTYTMASPDGVHFTPLANAPAYTDSDSGNTGMWDDTLKKYVAYRRMGVGAATAELTNQSSWYQRRKCSWCVGEPAHCGPGAGPSRLVGRCVSDTFTNFSGCERTPPTLEAPANVTENCSLVLAFDEQDNMCTDLYTNSAVQYEGFTIVFPSVYRHFPQPPAWSSPGLTLP